MMSSASLMHKNHRLLQISRWLWTNRIYRVNGEKGKFPAQPYQNLKAICEVNGQACLSCDHQEVKAVVTLWSEKELREAEQEKKNESEKQEVVPDKPNSSNKMKENEESKEQGKVD